MKITHKEYVPIEEVIIPFCEMREGEEGTIECWHFYPEMVGLKVYVEDGLYKGKRIGSYRQCHISSPKQIKELLIKVRRRRT